jgi:hypothetical protein
MMDFITRNLTGRNECGAGTLARHGRAAAGLQLSATAADKLLNVSNSFQIIATSYKLSPSLTPISRQEAL